MHEKLAVGMYEHSHTHTGKCAQKHDFNLSSRAQTGGSPSFICETHTHRLIRVTLDCGVS